MRRSKAAVSLGLVLGIALSAVVFVYGYSRYVLSLPTYVDTEETIPIEENLEDIEDLEPEMSEGMEKPVFSEPGIRNILLIGSDRRDQKSHGRSDSMILVSINEKTRKIHLTSFGRTIWVSIPDDADPAYAKYWSPNYTLNAAHTWGGSRLLLKTIHRNFRIDVQDYVKVDFVSFVKVIDQIGGVEIELSKSEANHLRGQGFSLKAGNELLNGEEALAYSRIRKIDNDWNRMGRQRTVIESLIHKMLNMSSTAILKMPERIMPHLETNISQAEVQSYLLKALDYRKYEIDQMYLPIETYEALAKTSRGQEVYKIDWVKNIDALMEFIEN
ncbi:MAG: hypothetical protein GX834_03345 [Clostridiaceae bacterium]|nr:hypothetical protein [Clostridiaceae bacterium]